MFENIFKKDVLAADASAAEAQTASTALLADGSAPVPLTLSAEELQAWHQRLDAAANDDTALLHIAHHAPTPPLKLAAIEALTHEDAFRQAMQDFREADKRLYRAAKSRWDKARATRIATAEADALIASAHALLALEVVAVNRVLDLDHAWAALGSKLLDPALPAEFAALSAQLGAKVRVRGEHAQALTRWLAAADDAMANLSAALPGVAYGTAAPADAQTLALGLLELVHNTAEPDDTRCIEKSAVARRLLALASSVVERAKFLQSLPASGSADDAGEKLLIEQWRGFPELSEGELHTVLATRFADWRNTGAHTRQHEQQTQSAHERARRAEQQQQRVAAIQRDVEAAEAAQAGGHVADLTRLLGAIDQGLKRGPLTGNLAPRIESLRREQRRLQDWQRWSGGQGREQLVAEAQALAAAGSGKVVLKAHTEAINKLRERWKELDKLGAASKQTVWLAFDGALEAAHAPVAAHLQKLKLARQENLAARKQIIAGLTQAAAKFFPAAQEDAAADANAVDWRALAHTLDEAQAAWRKLGPVEHTVPRKTLQGDNAITTRYAAALQALQAPLQNVYGEARSQREQLVAGAKQIAASDVSARDVVDKVRKLQTQWQAVAKALPLPRRDENTLWMAFKTATDAIFTARDTARAASEAEFNAKQKARAEIIERVAALASATTATDIKRTLSESDNAWRAAPEAPKAQAAKLDARYRAARDAAARHISELALHAEQARYDALLAKIRLCHEREALALSAEQTAALETRWNAVAHLPEAWKSRIDARFQGHATENAKPGASLQDILLNLEVACGIDSPQEFLAARQHLKIRALKNAMEGRQNTATTPAEIERWMLEAAASARPDETSRERLTKIIAAVRRRRQS